MDKFKSVNFKKIFLLFAISFTFVGNSAFASDNVLQAIQVDGTKDSYNVILKSDDVAELRKTIQAPNKMVLDLKGIRASKTINTIYNNTSTVDSVVVEPTGENSVKILIQADNVANAGVHFDTLKTPLGVLDKSENKTQSDELVLNKPMQSYTPVYNETEEEEASFTGSTVISGIKKVLKNEKISWTLTFGLFAIFILSGIKTMRGSDSDIKVGLSQSLKDRELNLYRGASEFQVDSTLGQNNNINSQNMTGANYGLRAYQNGSRSPYSTPEVQSVRPRPVAAPSVNAQPIMNRNVATKSASPIQSPIAIMQATVPSTMQNSALRPTASNKKTTNIDSIKFLESMTKIYEKNGRTDLAQGLKANMKKAKVNLA